jgi:hypothetical protein
MTLAIALFAIQIQAVLFDITVAATSRAIPAPLIADAMREVESVWREEGIAIEWHGDDTAARSTPAPLYIVVGDRCPAGAGSERSLASIMFVDGAPVGRIVVCYGNVLSLVARDRAGFAMLPSRGRDAMLARAMGRAIAHEIGHYLLGRDHANRGLMRAAHSIEDLSGMDRAAFALGEDERTRAVEKARLVHPFAASDDGVADHQQTVERGCPHANNARPNANTQSPIAWCSTPGW